jgi:hypothetical protein
MWLVVEKRVHLQAGNYKTYLPGPPGKISLLVIYIIIRGHHNIKNRGVQESNARARGIRAKTSIQALATVSFWRSAPVDNIPSKLASDRSSTADVPR